jgi:hypothetical protein
MASGWPANPLRWAVAIASMVPSLAIGAEPRRDAKAAEELAGYDAIVTAEDREHWAFRPVEKPPAPEVKRRDWARNPIDRFVLAGLEEAGWSPAPPVGPRALLRRLYLDVTGLPPTPDEQERFLAAFERDPLAVERVVDDLLSRPAYGERWGRHWLDVVRFAETNGYERDATKPFAWRYRDYVIRSFNDDTPYDRFIVEQLAGDELPDDQVTPETLVAVGYYRLGPWDDEPADPKQDRADQLDDLVATTSEVFLGLTLACARCHNHKFEPLTMHDYYRMVAVFDPLKRPQQGRSEVPLPLGTPAEIAAEAERDARMRPLLLAQREIRKQTDSAETAARLAAVEEQIRRLRAERPDLPRGYRLDEPSAVPPETHLLLRGQAANPGPRVAPGVPAVLTSQPLTFPDPAPGARTTRYRLTLARWIASPRNPLTARVMVNRVWQAHLGAGLVRTPGDFGTAGEPPTHPELLDWLASWFVENGYSLKKLHRLILTSATYRMSTRGNPSYAADDPEDQLLWKFPYRRLEAEAIRDGMLAASGRLNRSMYGPSMYPFIPKEAIESHSDPREVWTSSGEQDASRRTVYAFTKRSLIVPMLELLDFCDTTRSTARRNVTSVPTQALTLLNGDFVNRQARHLADRLEREAGPDPARQVDLAFRLTLCRPPSDAERQMSLRFLGRESGGGAPGPAPARHEALVQFCRAVFNINEFVYPD